MGDLTKLYNGIIQSVSVHDGGAGDTVDLGLIGDGAFTVKLEPVTVKNSAGETIVVAYDASMEVNLMEVQNVSSVKAHNNVVNSLYLGDERADGDVYVAISPFRLNIAVDMNFNDTGKSVIKITGTKRIPVSDVDSVVNLNGTLP